MRRKIAVLLSGILLSCAAGAQDCPALEGARKLSSERYVLSYRTEPSKIAVGQHFVVELAVCPKAGQPAPDNVQVDGFMPDHNHGMNYKAVIKSAGTRRYSATGMMFHMPGKWQFIFDIRGSGKTDRVIDTLALQ